MSEPVGRLGPDGMVVAGDALRDALLQSRQRWRDLLSLATDFAFETDAWGRFAFVMPEGALGWQTSELLGQPADRLLGDGGEIDGASPFRPDAPIRDRRAWLRRADGALCCFRLAAAPLFGPDGAVAGARGIGVDVTDEDGREDRTAAALRRGEVIEGLLWRMRREALAPRMLQAALQALVGALGAEGAALIDPDGPTLATVLHQVGNGSGAIAGTAAALLEAGMPTAAQAQAPDGRLVLVSSCPSRAADRAGLAIWRTRDGRGWDGEDHVLLPAAATILRLVLDHEAIQREMGLAARTDGLTGLYNRRAFTDELVRYVDRLDRDRLPGTLLIADLDHFAEINDRLGHEFGDRAIAATGRLLRDLVRPTDLVARVGGDEFALFLQGADELTAAERAEHVRLEAPRVLARALDITDPALTLSVGIACREAGGNEPADQLMHRAEHAMRAAKEAGRSHWRVCPPAMPL